MQKKKKETLYESVKNVYMYKFCIYVSFDLKFIRRIHIVYIYVYVKIKSYNLNTLANKHKLMISAGVDLGKQNLKKFLKGYAIYRSACQIC